MTKNSQFTIHNSQFIIHYSLFILLIATLLSTPRPILAQEPPTPDAEGNIIITVQANDSLWSIAARAGISMDELLTLNNLTEDSIITPGQQLIIGQGPPPTTPTPAIPPTAAATKPPPPPPATAVPPPPTSICLKAFSDLNRNGAHDAGEPFKDAVAFTIFNADTVVGNYVTDGVSEPYCLDGLSPGDYKITRSISPEETLTTAGDWTINLALGNVVELAFGSYTAVTPTPANPTTIGHDISDPPPNTTDRLPENRPNFIFIGASLVVIFLLSGWLIRQLKNRGRH